MPGSRPDMTIYFDEAGHTGNDLSHDLQRNFLLAGVAILQDEEFWESADALWRKAEVTLGMPRGSVELKASQMYGGWKSFDGVPSEERSLILNAIADFLIMNRVEILWDGMPKHGWATRMESVPEGDRPAFFDAVLFAFCNELEAVASKRYPNHSLQIIGDENSWVSDGHILRYVSPGKWDHLVDGGIGFSTSKTTRGLQLADFAVHTLYRANKNQVPDPNRERPSLTPTDHVALGIHQRIAEAGLWLNLTELRSRRNDQPRGGPRERNAPGMNHDLLETLEGSSGGCAEEKNNKKHPTGKSTAKVTFKLTGPLKRSTFADELLDPLEEAIVNLLHWSWSTRLQTTRLLDSLKRETDWRSGSKIARQRRFSATTFDEHMVLVAARNLDRAYERAPKSVKRSVPLGEVPRRGLQLMRNMYEHWDKVKPGLRRKNDRAKTALDAIRKGFPDADPWSLTIDTDTGDVVLAGVVGLHKLVGELRRFEAGILRFRRSHPETS